MQSFKQSPEPWIPSEQKDGSRMFAPAAQRNREDIGAALGRLLPPQGIVLELASGSGEHVVHFASLFPGLIWQPSDSDTKALGSIEAWREYANLSNILPPVRIDVGASKWPLLSADAVLCINMVHISPWSATQGMVTAARGLLGDGQPLIVYGPFKQKDVETAPSNVAFDIALRDRNPEWGLRAVEDVVAFASEVGFSRYEVVRMPANNLMVAMHA